MRENAGQEHRAFMAILLAMGVLFAWNYFFPVTPPPPPENSDTPVSESPTGFAEADPNAPFDATADPSMPSDPVTDPYTGTETTEPRGNAGSLLGVQSGGQGLGGRR